MTEDEARQVREGDRIVLHDDAGVPVQTIVTYVSHRGICPPYFRTVAVPQLTSYQLCRLPARETAR